MIILYDATIDCAKEQREVYEWAFGDYEVDDDGNRVLNDRRLPIPINPIKFPLQHCTVTHFGSRITVSIKRPGAPDFRLDEIAKAPAPKRVSKGNKEIYQIGGVSNRLLRQNVDVEHALVDFTVTRWSAQHLPNQKLQVLSGDDE